MSVPDELGEIVQLWRYPVKSMAGELLQETSVSWYGVEGDRRWAFVRQGQVRSGFPWLTQRENPELARYAPSGERVRCPSGAWYDVTDPALARELAAASVIKQDRGIFDALPLSLLTTRTLASLALDVRRFRPNLVIATQADGSFPEDAWVGSVLRIGSLRLRVDKPIQRCTIPNLDPDTLQSNEQILRSLARERQALLGVYAQVVEPGRVALGDRVLREG